MNRRRLITFIAVFHLAILASGMIGLWDRTGITARKFRHTYETFTGAGGGFGFFSPSVGQQLVLKFELKNKAGETRLLRLEELVPNEVAIRLGNMVRFLAYSYKDKRLRRAIAGSFAAYIFTRFPDTAEVNVVGTAYRFPSIDEFRGGVAVEERPVYRIQFRRQTEVANAK